MITVTTDYHVRNSRGLPVYTSPDQVLACTEADRRSNLGEDVSVHKVTTRTTSTEVYRPSAPKEQARAA